MRGIYLTQHESQNALNLSQYRFEKYWKPKLQWKLQKQRVKYFIPEDDMTETAKKAYASRMIDYDEEAEEVEEILGDVSDTQETSGLFSSEWQAARIENLKARTKYVEERLEQHKKELFEEWSEKFYEVFAESFARFKNELISLHLNEDQLSTLNEKLDNSLKMMQDKLISIWLDFEKEQE